MSPEAQRIAIAEACGWTRQQIDGLQTPFLGGTVRMGKPIPDYLNDLNAMHEAEKVLTRDQEAECWLILCRDVVPLSGSAWRANAAQRAEAFLKTLGLWK